MAGLDIDRHGDLIAYLRERGAVDRDEVPTTRTLAGGVSCRTIRITRESGEEWVAKQALARLRVETEWLSDPRRVHREAMVMELLADLVPPGSLPGLVFEDLEEHVVVMQAVPRPHSVWKALLLDGDVRADHVVQFGSLLASIHRESTAAADVFAQAFRDREFFETLRIDPYYTFSGKQRPEAASFLADLVSDTRSELITLTHGDYSPKNVLVHRDQLVLLDHEVAHWGDGAFDLGFGMTHLLAKARHVDGGRDRFAEAARLFWDTYRSEAGAPFDAGAYERRVVHHAIGCVLARAVGKSPLEYLGPAARRAQADSAVALMADPPDTVAELVERWAELPAYGAIQ